MVGNKHLHPSETGCVTRSYYPKVPRCVECKHPPDLAEAARYHLQPLTRKYLYSKADFGIDTHSFSFLGARFGDIHYVTTSLCGFRIPEKKCRLYRRTIGDDIATNDQR